MAKETNKDQAAKEKEVVDQQFQNNLEQVFTLARLQLVTSSPNDKKALIDLINFETQAMKRII